MNMKECYFGDFDPEHTRNRVIIHGLKKNGADVVICRTIKKGVIQKMLDLRRQLRDVGDYDVIIVGYSDSRFYPILAKLISNKKIVWNPLYSLYESWILDRKLSGRYSLKSWYYYVLDLMAVRFADAILLDTNQNIEFF